MGIKLCLSFLRKQGSIRFSSKIILFFLIVVNFQLNAQSNWKGFWKQSTPIKCWVVTHPFKAKKAQIISEETKQITDSIAKTNLLDGDKFGGQVDAFRHAYWMARLRQEIGKGASLSLGRAYERSNKKSFRKSKRKGEISGYDKVSKQMDLFNNKVGVTFTKKREIIQKNELINEIINSIKEGKFKIIKKDSAGNCLDCNGKKLSKTKHNDWKSLKCLVFSKL
ncbi:hypothetical protein SAMN05444411_11317 [Lutibacter oricola]|uniref:DUF6973 domain-containing protein n=1 Tax=Lutibacter oricola TaxID=762486 RepID=A0A1H3G498_9FLAO|nr:hypothetical protein [Lutibacter oricola]SDX97199.1 hypothetical protein SAMN05444411_11317 [Lutibacter oricola]